MEYHCGRMDRITFSPGNAKFQVVSGFRQCFQWWTLCIVMGKRTHSRSPGISVCSDSLGWAVYGMRSSHFLVVIAEILFNSYTIRRPSWALSTLLVCMFWNLIRESPEKRPLHCDVNNKIIYIYSPVPSNLGIPAQQEGSPFYSFSLWYFMSCLHSGECIGITKLFFECLSSHRHSERTLPSRLDGREVWNMFPPASVIHRENEVWKAYIINIGLGSYLLASNRCCWVSTMAKISRLFHIVLLATSSLAFDYVVVGGGTA